MNLAQRDQSAIWHPYTQHKMCALPSPIVRGEGTYLIDEQGRRYLDLISSWWVNLHGHSHPKVAQAIYQQAMTLEHVIFSGFTHQPAVLLAEELLKLLPSGMSKIFYSDNGSTAVEIALKMAYQYWRNLNQPQRRRFIAFQGGYHGDTFGAMSIGKKSGFFTQFEELMFEVDTFSYPATWMGDEDITQKEQQILAKIGQYLDEVAHETAAVIIEPLVQGSSGMNMCRPQFLRELEVLAHGHDVLVIYDEVMTGFGRTGDLFACRKAETSPDIICLAKGLTAGFLPLSVTACHEKIYQAFFGDSFDKALAHGHSFTANPLGCAAALASLELLIHPETQARIAMIENVHREVLSRPLLHLPVEKMRYCGTIAAFDLTTSTEYGSSFSLKLREIFLKKGFLIRPIGNVIYFMPPYCITEKELRDAYEVVANEIQGVIA